ncbi:MAG: ABC transporter ATP-binding protein [Deltaproteobacteria bacterium]|nr:ABC transporter ATP-binding protein [Deltaproteobacteria bacterium]MBW2305503.1 ABC transporter ATP-binding protein [Deltaproteobacteria bacterium]
MIHMRNLTKKYGELAAVNNISLHVRRGEVFGFLGPNGAGKTTTIKMLAGLLRPTGGQILVGGYDVVQHPIQAKRIIGFIPDRPFLYDKLTGLEFMQFMAGLYGMNHDSFADRAGRLLRLFDLEEWRGELIESYSHGMKQRLIIASALLHQPQLIVVDEPLVGLDPRGARMVKDIFRNLAARNDVAIFMSTHTLEVAQETCHRIAIIQEGSVVAVGTFDELQHKAGVSNPRLESIFLRLTGGEEMKEIIEVLRE